MNPLMVCLGRLQYHCVLQSCPHFAIPHVAPGGDQLGNGRCCEGYCDNLERQMSCIVWNVLEDEHASTNP